MIEGIDIQEKINEVGVSSFKSIDIGDKLIFNSYFTRFPLKISEYSFTNLFMWRKSYEFQWTEYKDNLLLISVKNPALIKAFPPIGKDPILAIKYLYSLAQKLDVPLVFHRIPLDYLPYFDEFQDKIKKIEDRDNFDYIYARDRMISLYGKELANKRKNLNRFKNRNEWNYESLTSEHIPEILNLQEEWCKNLECEGRINLRYEHEGIVDILTHMKDLDFMGGVLKVDGNVVAFCLYEKLDNETYVCHVEKAKREILGSYEAINQVYCNQIPDKIRFVNREQDLGIKNLRIAKERYQPDTFIKKYQIFFEK